MSIKSCQGTIGWTHSFLLLLLCINATVATSRHHRARGGYTPDSSPIRFIYVCMYLQVVRTPWLVEEHLNIREEVLLVSGLCQTVSWAHALTVLRSTRQTMPTFTLMLLGWGNGKKNDRHLVTCCVHLFGQGLNFCMCSYSPPYNWWRGWLEMSLHTNPAFKRDRYTFTFLSHMLGQR